MLKKRKNLKIFFLRLLTSCDDHVMRTYMHTCSFVYMFYVRATMFSYTLINFGHRLVDVNMILFVEHGNVQWYARSSSMCMKICMMNMYVRMNMYACMYICSYIYAYMRMYIHTYIRSSFLKGNPVCIVRVKSSCSITVQ